MTPTLYGIRNCDTVRKARRWLDDHGVAYRFHDFRVDGIDDERLASWLRQCDWQQLVNRRSSTWKNLPVQRREAMDGQAAREAIAEAPTLVKRPVLEGDGLLEIGFDEARYAAIFDGPHGAAGTQEKGDKR